MSEAGYTMLEFVGTVVTTPKYSNETNALTFCAKSPGTPPLRMVVLGRNAKPFRVLLKKGTGIKAVATPINVTMGVNGVKVTTVVWEMKSLFVLGWREKTELADYADVRILDSLMPRLGDYNDVGYVDIQAVQRQDEAMARFEAIEESLKKPKEAG